MVREFVRLILPPNPIFGLLQALMPSAVPLVGSASSIAERIGFNLRREFFEELKMV
jgi:hypothetical protein